ncbi:MAG TPA: excalibur calcium-binding domain-containing protein [Solirubrobacteraceae bacterium]|jgi:hypothetical protein|nr:excalibur calcium-binding domain-containing protein [Solirubrobacteraceae bacterium]
MTSARRRPRLAVWVLACLVLAAAAIAVAAALTSGGGDASASANPACAGRSQRSVECPHNATFTPSQYLDHGDAFGCINFASQADAQAVLRADPSDPNRLDVEPGGVSAQRDGIACRTLPGPTDLTPVKAVVDRLRCHKGDTRSARCPQPARRFEPRDYLMHRIDEYDCSAFASQADAQAVLRVEPDDPNRLDGDRNGIACPDLPAPKDLKPVPTGPSS